MRLLEYQAKRIAAAEGFPVPEGTICANPEEAGVAAEKLGGPVAVKSQVHAGGRGKAGGILFAENPQEAVNAARKLIGSKVRELTVEKVLIERKLEVAAEYYLGMIIDENGRRDALLMGKGGVDVEEAAGKGGINKLAIYPLEGMMNFRAKLLAEDCGIEGKLLNSITRLAVKLYGIYVRYDATLLEVNPLVVTDTGEVFAGDMRMEIDDDALGRQERALAAFGIEPGEDKGRPPTALEVEAEKIDKIDHRGVAGRVVEFDGDIGLIIGGGGASLTVMDAVYRYGGRPANYCEIGGNPTVKKIRLLTEAILKKPGISKMAVITNVLSNTRVDLVARGVILGLMDRGIDPAEFPIVFRVPGSWEDDGFRILDKYSIKYFDRTHSMDEAAKYIVEMEV